MSTIELVDPELRDALAPWSQVRLTAETLTQRRADGLALLGSFPLPDLPDIATGGIHVESAFGAKPIRVLTYRPVRSESPLPVIVHTAEDRHRQTGAGKQQGDLAHANSAVPDDKAARSQLADQPGNGSQREIDADPSGVDMRARR